MAIRIASTNVEAAVARVAKMTPAEVAAEHKAAKARIAKAKAPTKPKAKPQAIEPAPQAAAASIETASPDPEGYMRRQAAAVRAGVTPQLLDYWLTTYGIPTIREGRKVLIKVDALDAVISARSALKGKRVA